MWLVLGASVLEAQSLRGSWASVDRQHDAAVQHDYSFLENGREVRRFIGLGLLVPVRGGGDYRTAGASYPYARPATRTFVERLAGQYRAACNERLVVTSLTRPAARQPSNASEHSVHPTGMAVDLRVSRKRACRSWLERTLLALERAGVLEATRERRPAHYHVAVFPRQYAAHVRQVARASSAAERRAPVVATRYRVQSGDTLWSIARARGTSVEALQALNGLDSAHIRAGQTLRVPGSL
jgi:LysM repeat protein